MAHPEPGMGLQHADFNSVAKVEHQPKMEGRQRVMAPAPK